jgi:hypothetical protein
MTYRMALNDLRGDKTDVARQFCGSMLSGAATAAKLVKAPAAAAVAAIAVLRDSGCIRDPADFTPLRP